MTVIDGRTWLEHLNAPRCWELLASTPIGRIGVLNDSAPEIYPVNHMVNRQSIVFRTDPGTKLRSLLRSPAVCYEVDGVNPDGTGWSVLVKGRAVRVRDHAEVAALARLPLRYWVLGDKADWVRIVPAEVTGRRTWSSPTTSGADAGVGPAPSDRS
jgi:uncharacterized protein